MHTAKLVNIKHTGMIGLPVGARSEERETEHLTVKALRMEEGLERGFDEVKQASGFVTANSIALLTIFQVSQTQNAAVKSFLSLGFVSLFFCIKSSLCVLHPKLTSVTLCTRT